MLYSHSLTDTDIQVVTDTEATIPKGITAHPVSLTTPRQDRYWGNNSQGNYSTPSISHYPQVGTNIGAIIPKGITAHPHLSLPNYKVNYQNVYEIRNFKFLKVYHIKNSTHTAK